MRLNGFTRSVIINNRTSLLFRNDCFSNYSKRLYITFPKKIGIVGTGSLGESLATMFLFRKNNPFDLVTCSVRRAEHKHQLEEKLLFSPIPAKITTDNNQVVENSDCLILSVKPGQIKSVCEEINNNINPDTPVISVSAAVPLIKLHEWLTRTNTLIRCMPNIPCVIGKGVVTYTCNNNNENILTFLQELFSPNLLISLNNDKEIDASTLISGCGPAFLSWYINCIRQIGNESIQGSDLDDMIIQTMIGTAHMLKHMNSHDIIRAVASPNGVTEATLRSLQQQGVNDNIRKSFVSAQNRINSIIDTL